MENERKSPVTRLILLFLVGLVLTALSAETADLVNPHHGYVIPLEALPPEVREVIASGRPRKPGDLDFEAIVRHLESSPSAPKLGDFRRARLQRTWWFPLSVHALAMIVWALFLQRPKPLETVCFIIPVILCLGWAFGSQVHPHLRKPHEMAQFNLVGQLEAAHQSDRGKSDRSTTSPDAAHRR